MKTPVISEQDQRKLRNCAKEELRRMKKMMSDASVVELLDEFKNKFNICETVYKIVLEEHQKRKGKKDGCLLQVTMTQVPYALAFAGYTFEKELLNELFGAKSKKGMTVKKLRNAVTHGIDPKAVEEIVSRKEELFGYMDAFLEGIDTFDDMADSAVA